MAMINKQQLLSRAHKQLRARKQRADAGARARRERAARKMRAGPSPDEALLPTISAEPMPSGVVEPERFLQARLIFDQRLNNEYAYTPPRFNDLLGSQDILEFVFFLDGPQGSSMSTTLIMEHGPDGVNWATHPYWLDLVSFSGNTLYRFNNAAFPLSSGFRKLLLGVFGGSARARLWVTSRGIARRRFMEVVFDQTVNSGGTGYYSDDLLASQLASSDKLQLFAVVTDEAVGTSPTLTVQIEESPDGITWKNKQATPEINATVLSVGALTKVTGEDAGAQPTSAFVRFRIALGGSSTRAHVLLYVTGRGQ